MEVCDGGSDAASVSAMPSVREARVARLLTIRALAQHAGVAPSTVYLTEAGRSKPHLSVMRRLAEALGVEPHEIDEFRRAIAAAAQGPSRSGQPPAP